MKKILFVCCILVLFTQSAFADSVPTDEEMLTLLKAIGCSALALIGLPMLVLGLFCAGIRAIRGFFDI